MNETDISTGNDDFFSAFEEGLDYQTETSETEETETVAESAGDDPQQTQEGSQGEEAEGGKAAEGEEKTAPESAGQPETFTLKVNKEQRQVSREEVITLAQKGMDYDRVKERSERAKSDNEALTAEISRIKPVYETLSQLARDSGMEVGQLLDSLQISAIAKKENVSEAIAAERLRTMKANQEIERLKNGTAKPESPKPTRAQAELEEFRKEFPDIEPRDIPMDKLMPDIESGKTMTQAYRNFQAKQQAEEIERLKSELAAERQNKSNRAASPGSASDSGSRKTKDPNEDFWAAFEK